MSCATVLRVSSTGMRRVVEPGRRARLSAVREVGSGGGNISGEDAAFFTGRVRPALDLVLGWELWEGATAGVLAYGGR